MILRNGVNKYAGDVHDYSAQVLCSRIDILYRVANMAC